jgi:hypothetical protein
LGRAVSYRRPQAAALAERLAETRRHLQVVAGPRQVGKTTLVQQVVEAAGLPVRFASADEPTLRGAEWIDQQWQAARLEAGHAGKSGAVLVLDEIQKVPGWSEAVKRLWDEDTRKRVPLKVVLLGSAPLMVAHGLTESLAGRFEVLRLPHWSFAEMREAFDFSLDQYVFYGGYPGAAPLVRQPQRWARYIADSLIETSISRDVLLLTRVDKPALLRRLFELACRYSVSVQQTASQTESQLVLHARMHVKRVTRGMGGACEALARERSERARVRRCDGVQCLDATEVERSIPAGRRCGSSSRPQPIGSDTAAPQRARFGCACGRDASARIRGGPGWRRRCERCGISLRDRAAQRRDRASSCSL